MAWAIEWEGSISLWKSKKQGGYTPVISVSNTREKLLRRFSELVSYGHFGLRELSDGKRRDRYVWYICSHSLTNKFCREILPYLTTKNKQAELLIEYTNKRLVLPRYGSGTKYIADERDKYIYDEIKRLNRRGL